MIYFTARIKFLLLTILFLGTALQTFAAVGDLDPSFGSGGFVITDAGSDSEGIRDLAVQPDGKIVAIGNSFVGSTHQTTILRYNSNGSIDSTFGTGGKVIVQNVFPYELALQSNGKIVFVGTSGLSTTGAAANSDFYIARLNSDGTFDATFNGTGTVTLDLRGAGDSAQSVEIQPDGKILTGGSSARQAPDLRSDFAIIRFNADGSLDTTFDGDGKVFTMIPPTGESAGIEDLGIQPDGKILAAGSVNVVDTPGDDPDRIFALVRYNANGSLDTTFDGDGVANPRFLPASGNGTTSTSIPTNIFARNDGKILVVGNASTCCSPPKSQVALVRFNADGSFDTTFANDGKALISFPAESFRVGEVSIQTDNKIVLAGIAGNVNQTSLAIARLTSDGALDLTFSGDGRTDFVPSLSKKTATTVALQPDGKIVTGGSAPDSNSSGRDFLLARFEGAGCTTNCGTLGRRSAPDFDGDRKADVSLYRPSDRIWYIQNSGNSTISYTQFGLANDKITPADYDGDAKTDIAVFRPETGVWFVLRSTGGVYIVRYGAAEDIPQPADYNGDGKAEVAVYRPSIGVWFILNPETNQSRIIQFGASEDKPVASDYNGDGKTELAVYRPSSGVWYFATSETNYDQYNAVKFGISTDKTGPADYDGDGKTDIAVYRPAEGNWYLLQSRDGYTVTKFGIATDAPTPADYDGDGRADIAVYRPSEGNWYLLQSKQGSSVMKFGVNADKPVANAFVY